MYLRGKPIFVRDREFGNGNCGHIVIVDEDADVEDEALHRVECAEVRSGVYGLPDTQREVVLRHYGFGQPVRTLQETADELGLTVRQVRYAEQQALAMLYELMTGEQQSSPELAEAA